MTIHRVDVAIVGAGLMGSCAAWQLTARGLSVAVLEAFEVGHDHGSSHGRSRSFRRAYRDPLYAAMTGLALEQWHRLESEVGSRLLTASGGIDHGPDDDAQELSSLMTDHGVTNELLTAPQAEKRWPGMRFRSDVVFHGCAGVFDPHSTTVAASALAAAAGARLMPMNRIVDANVVPTGEVALHSESGDQIIADSVVLTTGASLPEFAPAVAELAGSSGPVLPPLTIRQHKEFHFPLRPGVPTLPTFVHKNGTHMCGMSSGRDVDVPAMKIGYLHDGNNSSTVDPGNVIEDDHLRADSEVGRRSAIDYVTEWLPALDPTPVAESTGLLTMTPDGDFILDQSGPVLVAATCSGHGAKFAPLIGSMIADLLTGVAQTTPRFQMDRSASAEQMR